MYPLWVACWDTWPFVLLMLIFYYNLGCYHEQDLSGLTFYDKETSTTMGIHVLEKEWGFFESTCLISLSTMIYFIWYERNNWVFHQIYHPHQDVCKEIFLTHLVPFDWAWTKVSNLSCPRVHLTPSNVLRFHCLCCFSILLFCSGRLLLVT
jgi:hypothetical protein